MSASAPAGIVSAPQGTAFFGSGRVWDSTRREFFSQDHMNLATVLHDYDPTMSLAYLPPEIRAANPGQKPYAILQSNGTHEPYIVRYLDDEEIKNQTEILTQLFMGDTRYHDPRLIVERMEARDKAQAALRLSQQMEEADDRIDELAFMASGGRNKLHTVRHNGIKIDR